MSGLVGFVDPNNPNLPDYVTFLRRQVGIAASVLPDDSLFVTTTFAMATTLVNDALRVLPVIYTLAVYNLAADRVINFALDVTGQTFFKDLRHSLGLGGFVAGLISSSSDQGTSQSVEVIEAAKRMTISDLQLSKTIYGRTYLGFAQAYGPTVWGLT